MWSKVEEAGEVYHNHGFRMLSVRTAKFLLREALALPPVDDVCLYLSIKTLEQRKEAEEDIDDVLATVGTNADDFLPDQQYEGYGNYNSLLTTHAREPIKEVVDRVRDREPETVVEIGTWRGGSLYVWSRCFETADHIISIDINNVRHRRLFDHFNEEKQIDFVLGESSTDETVKHVSRLLGDDTIDFLYIDGNHAYESVSADFEAYRPLMSKNGIIGLDDVSESFPGVWKFYNEIESEYETEKVGYISGEGKKNENISSLVYL